MLEAEIKSFNNSNKNFNKAKVHPEINVKHLMANSNVFAAFVSDIRII